MNPGKKVRFKDKDDERELNSVLDEMQRDLDERNFKPRGISPSSDLFRRTEITVSVDASDVSVGANHSLRDQNGLMVVPNRWRVVDVDGECMIWRDPDIRWTNERVSFGVDPTDDTTFIIELWRA